MSKKFNLLEEHTPASISQNQNPAEEAKAEPAPTAYSKPQRAKEPPVASESEKGGSMELKKANLDRLPTQPMTYQ